MESLSFYCPLIYFHLTPEALKAGPPPVAIVNVSNERGKRRQQTRK